MRGSNDWALLPIPCSRTMGIPLPLSERSQERPSPLSCTMADIVISPYRARNVVQHPCLDDRNGCVKNDANEGEQHDCVEHHRGVGLPFPEGDEVAKL